jgi:hypothetical protein
MKVFAASHYYIGRQLILFFSGHQEEMVRVPQFAIFLGKKVARIPRKEYHQSVVSLST